MSLLIELVKPAFVAPEPSQLRRLAEGDSWETLCALAQSSGLGPLIHARLQNRAMELPAHVHEWLHAKHDQTMKTNLLLLDELKRITSRFTCLGIPVLVLKGPVLGLLGTGILLRPFHDLDLLVQRPDLEDARAALRSLGFTEVQAVQHDYHQIFLRRTHKGVVIVELHFDLVDRSRSYAPDLTGIWDRAVDVDIAGHAVRTPELTDHLLLTMMQLPHHHWIGRLVVDIGHIIFRWMDVIEWESLTQRAKAWRMQALAGSTLYAVGSLLLPNLPERDRAFMKPEGFYRRVQWHIAREAIMEHFVSTPSRGFRRVAPYLMVDRLDTLSWSLCRAIRWHVGFNQPNQVRTGFLQNLATGLSTLPPLVSALARAATERHSRT